MTAPAKTPTTDSHVSGAGHDLVRTPDPPAGSRHDDEAWAALERLTVAAVGGDATAMGEIYRELAPRVAGYCRARGVEDPEAVTQEVFLQLVGQSADLSGGWNGLRAFVFTVAHARCVDEHRRRGRRARLETYDPTTDRRAEASAEQQVIGREAADELLGVIGVLPEDQRTVILLRVLADLPVRETAYVTGHSEAMVKKLQRTAVFHLRRLLAPGTPDDHLREGE